MAIADGIAAEHPIKAAWKEMWGLQGEAISLCDLYRVADCPEVAWSLLAQGMLERFSDALERLNRAYSDAGMSPLTSHEIAGDEADDAGQIESGTNGLAGKGAFNGGMGAVAPMMTEVVDGELTSSRK